MYFRRIIYRTFNWYLVIYRYIYTAWLRHVTVSLEWFYSRSKFRKQFSTAASANLPFQDTSCDSQIKSKYRRTQFLSSSFFFLFFYQILFSVHFFHPVCHSSASLRYILYSFISYRIQFLLQQNLTAATCLPHHLSMGPYRSPGKSLASVQKHINGQSFVVGVYLLIVFHSLPSAKH